MIAIRKIYQPVAAVRCLLIGAGLAAAVFGGSSARAEDRYPTRPITIIVPFAAGGPTDILARLIAQSMSPTLGKQVVVEDVTGAGGTIGAARVARADPDGYTMVMGNLGTHAASLGIYQNLPYDPRTNFEPVILVASTPMVLVTRKTLAVHSLDETIAYAKANKGKATLGNAGIGSISHLTSLLFNHLTGADLVHVPYRGLSEATNDLLGGQIDLLFDQVVTATPHIVNGSENPIVVTIPQRAPSIPNVQSANEAGLPKLQPSRGRPCSCRNAPPPRSLRSSTMPCRKRCRILSSSNALVRSAPIFRPRSSARLRHSANWSMPKSTSGYR
jgi:tripartite-type tricarboxylate transporter receptor subunit TctC